MNIDMEIEDALSRIRDLWQRTNGKCALSFSGGKDSTVLAELYFMAKKRGYVGEIPLVFADTQVEFEAIKEFVKEFSKTRQEVLFLKPEKPFGRILKEYGKPAMSKVKSDFLSTYQKAVASGKNPLKGKRTSELILGVRTDRDYKPKLDEAGNPLPTRQKLANRHFHFLDASYKISSKCCDFLKKKPFEKYYIENDINGFMTGVRIEEGGVRSEMYKSCTSFKTVGNGSKKRKIVHKMPIFDWTTQVVDAFIEKYNVKLSNAYTEYGLDRTGCIGCPFAKDIQKNLKVLYEYEPHKYQAVQNWLGEVYMDLEIDLPFDESYTNRYERHKKSLHKRRYKMLQKYRPHVAPKWRSLQTQLDLEEE